MKHISKNHHLLLFVTLFALQACSDFFGTKQDDTTRQIFTEGRKDPTLIVDDVGYAALVPFWIGFDKPTSVFVGYDELVYVTDANGIHVLDRAGRKFREYPLNGAVSVTMDRKLNVYVAARLDTIIEAVDESLTWNLPAVYKLRGLNQAGDVEIVDILVHPFADASRTFSPRTRLIKDSPINDELVSFTGVTVLADNTLYVSRTGPDNRTGLPQAPDNTVLVYQEKLQSGVKLDQMENTFQVRALSPTTPSLASAVGLTAISSFVAPPQRDIFTSDKSFLIAQGGQNQNIPYRVLWISAVETVDGTEYRPNTTLLQLDTTRADRFLYSLNRFSNPTGIAFSTDGRNHIFVVDAATDSLYMFQSNGLEGVNPPVGSNQTKTRNVSFGGKGTGPRNFDEPSGVAYFRRVLYVADKNNNRIARYKLNTDFE